MANTGFGKIDTMTNFLMGCEKRVDDTWQPMANFTTQPNGELYQYYIDENTPDLEKQAAYENNIAKDEKDLLVNDITVEYNGNTYGGSYKDQSVIVNAMARINGKSQNKTQNHFTVTGEKVKLSIVDFQALLDLIEPLMEEATE